LPPTWLKFDECWADFDANHSKGPEFARYLREAATISLGPTGSGIWIAWDADAWCVVGKDGGKAGEMGIIS
jgi:hypothetical protein